MCVGLMWGLNLIESMSNVWFSGILGDEFLLGWYFVKWERVVVCLMKSVRWL